MKLFYVGEGERGRPSPRPSPRKRGEGESEGQLSDDDALGFGLAGVPRGIIEDAGDDTIVIASADAEIGETRALVVRLPAAPHPALHFVQGHPLPGSGRGEGQQISSEAPGEGPRGSRDGEE